MLNIQYFVRLPRAIGLRVRLLVNAFTSSGSKIQLASNEKCSTQSMRLCRKHRYRLEGYDIQTSA